MKKVRKAVIPAAGLGTRFLPATKTVPKEMLPIVDRPAISYVVEECVRSGIEDIVLISGRGKNAIEDFFDSSYEVEATLERTNNLEMLKRLRDLRESVNVISIRQRQALGLGHAVLCAQSVIGDEPFAVLLGDEIMIADQGAPTVTQQLMALHSSTGLASVAVMEVPRTEVHKYGIIDGKQLDDKTLQVNAVVEKPSAQNAPSQLALPGRYVFNADVFKFLKDVRPGKNGEIQLSDALGLLAKGPGLRATTFTGRRFDTGDLLGFLKANVELALEQPQLKKDFSEFIQQLAKKI